MSFRDSHAEALEYALPVRVPVGSGTVAKVADEPASYLPCHLAWRSVGNYVN